MSGYIDPCNYLASPRSTDPTVIIREKDIAIGHLLRLLAQREAEIQERERFIGELLRELAGIK